MLSPATLGVSGKEQLPTNAAISEQVAKQCEIKVI